MCWHGQTSLFMVVLTTREWIQSVSSPATASFHSALRVFFFLEIFIINMSPEIKPHTSSEDPARRAVQLSYL